MKQFVPEEVCLKCQGCCRFREQNSVWSPCLLNEEIQDLLDRGDIPAASISIDRRLLLIENSSKDGFVCSFLNCQSNACRIYSMRPFECQLYPFLLNMRAGKVLLTVDLNCPYISQKINSPELNDYIQYLTQYLNQPKQIDLLVDNPHIIQAYEEVKIVSELDYPDGLK